MFYNNTNYNVLGLSNDMFRSDLKYHLGVGTFLRNPNSRKNLYNRSSDSLTRGSGFHLKNFFSDITKHFSFVFHFRVTSMLHFIYFLATCVTMLVSFLYRSIITQVFRARRSLYKYITQVCTVPWEFSFGESTYIHSI